MPSVTVTTPEAGIARIAIDRPSKRNAVDPETRDALIAAIAAALGDDKVHAVLLGSEGGHFCAGGDIDSMAGLDIAGGRARMKRNHRLVRLLIEAEERALALAQSLAFNGPEFAEGRDAFADKRKPNFR